MGGAGNDTVFVNRMKISDIPDRFLFDMEKAAVFESMTKRQAGQNKESLCLLFFYMSRNQCRPVLMKSKLRCYLITKYKNLLSCPRQKPGEVV
jgi:hypothetical protein